MIPGKILISKPDLQEKILNCQETQQGIFRKHL